jgi:hypothetical protein
MQRMFGLTREIYTTHSYPNHPRHIRLLSSCLMKRIISNSLFDYLSCPPSLSRDCALLGALRIRQRDHFKSLASDFFQFLRLADFKRSAFILLLIFNIISSISY